VDNEVSLSQTSIKNLVIEELALGNINITQIAEKYKISRQTIYNWKNDEEFVSAVQRRKNILLNDRKNVANELLCSYITDAIETLHTIMSDTSVDSKTRKDCAIYLIDKTLPNKTGGGEQRPSNTYNIDNRKVVNNSISDILKKLNKDGE